MKDKWRAVLQWGAVLTFLLLPLSLVIIGFAAPEFAEKIRGYNFLGKFFESVTALVFGLAGLRSLDKFVETKNNGKKDHLPNDK